MAQVYNNSHFVTQDRWNVTGGRFKFLALQSLRSIRPSGSVNISQPSAFVIVGFIVPLRETNLFPVTCQGYRATRPSSLSATAKTSYHGQCMLSRKMEGKNIILPSIVAVTLGLVTIFG